MTLARAFTLLLTGLLPLTSSGSFAAALQPCAMDGSTLGVSRVVEIDTSTGAMFGSISTQAKEPRFLGNKEVVLTFDDGPMPPVTRSILDTLDRFCTKATFFSVGRMAIAYPTTIASILQRGHTLGTHTWSHPLNLKRLSGEKANEEIEKGYAAVSMAAGQPIAPFFRFPGLSDNSAMMRHLQGRGIAAFTVDTVSNDSYIHDPEKLLAHVLRELEVQHGGIVLFHDIKPATARMLPRFLTELRARGYKVVHLRAKGQVAPIKTWDASLAPMLAKSQKSADAHELVPFYGRVAPNELGGAEPSVTEIMPTAKTRLDRKSAVASDDKAPTTTAVRGWSARVQPGPGAKSTPGGWNTFPN